MRTANGDSIAARIIVLHKSGGVSVSTYDTAENGTFAIEVESDGLVAAAASAPGYTSHEIDLGDRIPSNISFSLHPLRVIQGSVKDKEQDPQEGAEIRLRYLNSSRHLHLDDGMTAVTDSSGAFVVAAPTSGSRQFVVDVKSQGWVPQSSKVLGSGSVGNTGSGSGSLDSILIELESQGATLSGRVTSPSGSGISGIPILIGVRTQTATTGATTTPGGITGPGTGTIRPYGARFTTWAVTGSDGRYTLSGLPPGPLAVVAIKRGVRMTPQNLQSTEGGSLAANFVIPD